MRQMTSIAAGEPKEDAAVMDIPMDVGQRIKISYAWGETWTVIRGWRPPDVILADRSKNGDEKEALSGMPCEVKYFRQGSYHRFQSEILEIVGTSPVTKLLALRFPKKIISQNLRSYPRIKTHLPAGFTDSNGESRPCIVKDLSLGGFLAEIGDTNLAIADELELHCVLPTQKSIAGAKCRVKRDYGNRMYGLEFMELVNGNSAILEEFLMIFTEIHSLGAGAGVKEGVVGDIGEIALSDLLQILVSSRNSYQLDIENRSKHGRIYVKSSEIICATTTHRCGVDALCEMFSWPRGRYHLQKAEWIPPRNIHFSFDFLLLEVARRLDERKKDDDEKPADS